MLCLRLRGRRAWLENLFNKDMNLQEIEVFTLDQLSAFCAAVEAGSFSGAARKTGKGLTTISTAISTLEDHLGVALFDRAGRYPRLTSNGERLYAQANVLFRQVETIISSAEDSISSVESTLTIGLGELVPTTMVETIIENVSEKYPHTTIEILRAPREQLLALILDKKIELALIASLVILMKVSSFQV